MNADLKSILIADDEPLRRRLMRGMLEPDYAVVEARTSHEILTLAHHRAPDLIIMDLLIPGLDGYRCCRMLKADRVTRRIPVMILSSVDYGSDVDLCHLVQADACLFRPCTQKQVLKTVRQLLEAAPENPKVTLPLYAVPLGVKPWL